MDFQTHVTKGNEFFQNGLLDQAAASYREALAGEPGSADALHGLGLVEWRRGHFDQALKYLVQAEQHAPESPDVLNSLGEVYRLVGDVAKSREVLNRAIKLNPSFALAYNNLGMSYLAQDDFRQALAYFSSATQLDSSLAMAHFNQGIAFKELGLVEEAIAALRQAVKIAPDFAEAHLNLAIALLLSGQMLEGFEEYEWRNRISTPPVFDSPPWDGTVDPKGTLLVYAEQGLGDTLQFIRFIPFIAAQGMRVIVQCPPVLENLLQGVEGVSMTYRQDEALPPHSAHVSLMSLPRLFQVHLGKVPANVPYITTPFSKIVAWKEALTPFRDTICIGLRWAGNPDNTQDRGRSIPLKLFEALADIPNVTWVNLQANPLSEEERQSAEKLGLKDFSDRLADFTDTAALVEQLDLVISVDTAVLHLAGALGRPVWGLLKASPHWPWLLERDDSPWYPSARLFRQKTAGDWKAVVGQLTSLLQEVMQSIREEKQPS